VRLSSGRTKKSMGLQRDSPPCRTYLGLTVPREGIPEGFWPTAVSRVGIDRRCLWSESILGQLRCMARANQSLGAKQTGQDKQGKPSIPLPWAPQRQTPGERTPARQGSTGRMLRTQFAIGVGQNTCRKVTPFLARLLYPAHGIS
jgi:hypothetical protein